jgi:hypothetical protein
MIPQTIKDAFLFIDYLHSNIENFNLLNPKIDEYHNLLKEKSKYYNKGFHEQKKYNKLQVEVVEVYDILKNEAILKIISKANNLGLTFIDDMFNIDFDEIQKFNKIAVDEDIKIIELHKSKYLEFREHCTKVVSLFNVLTFKDLDEDLLRLFEYFSENKKEFDFLKPKIVLNKQESTKQKPQHPKKISYQNQKTEILKNVYKRLHDSQDFKFFQIELIADLKLDDNVYKNIKQKNNDSILTSENWEANKEVFFTQRLGTYPESFTVEEKINLQLKYIENLNTTTEDYEILKQRYKDLLKAKNETEKTDFGQKKQFDFKPTDFNKDGFDLFNYLINNYADLTRVTGQQKRLSNLWHFMKNDNKKTDIYKFYFTKNRYKEHILEEYKIKITNTDKSPDKYPKEELPILNNLLIQFEDMKKE